MNTSQLPKRNGKKLFLGSSSPKNAWSGAGSPKAIAARSDDDSELRISHGNPRLSTIATKSSLTPSSISTKNFSFHDSFEKIFKLSYYDISSLDNLLFAAKDKIEILLKSEFSQNEKIISSEIKETFYNLKKSLYGLISEILTKMKNSKYFSRQGTEEETIGSTSGYYDKLLESNREIVSVMSELHKSKDIIKSVQQDLSRRVPEIHQLESRISDLNIMYEVEKEKNCELNMRIVELINEKDSLLNSIKGLSSFVTSYDKLDLSVNNSENYEEKFNGLSPIERTSVRDTFGCYSDDINLCKANFETMLKENKDLKHNLLLSAHNYNHLCGKFKIQQEEFYKFKDDTNTRKNDKAETLNHARTKLISIFLKISSRNNQLFAANEPLESIISQIDTNLSENLRILESTKQELLNSQNKCKGLLEQLEAIRKTSSKDVALLNIKITEFKNEIDSLKISAADAKEEQRKTAENLRKEIIRLENELKQSLSRIEVLQKENIYKEEHVAKLNTYLEDAHLEKMDEIRSFTQSYLERSSRENYKINSVVEKLEKLLEIKEFEVECLCKKYDNVISVIADKDKSITDLKKSLIKSVFENESLITSVEELRCAAEKNKNALAEKEIQIIDMQSRVESQSNVNKKIRETIVSMRGEVIDSYQSQLDKKNNIISELEQNILELEKNKFKNEESLHSQNQKLVQELNQPRYDEFLKNEINMFMHLLENQNEKLKNRILKIRHDYAHLVPMNFSHSKDKLEIDCDIIIDKFLSKSEPGSASIKSGCFRTITHEKNGLIDELFAYLELMKNEHSNLKALSINIQQEFEKYETELQEKNKKLLILESSLKFQECQNESMQEIYMQQKNTISRYELLLSEKDMKYKEITESQRNSNVLVNSSIKSIKKSFKEKYKLKIKLDESNFQRILSEKDNELANLKKVNEDLAKQLLEEASKLRNFESISFNYDHKIERLYKDLNTTEEVLGKYKFQNHEDENVIYSLNQELMQAEQENERLRDAQSKILQEKLLIIEERDDAINNLQKAIERARSEKDEDSLSESNIENCGEHVNRLLKELREKERSLKKNNKRVLELQWKNHDLIETLVDYEKKITESLENTEKLNFDIHELIEERDRLKAIVENLTKENEFLKSSTSELRDQLAILKSIETKLEENLNNFKVIS